MQARLNTNVIDVKKALKEHVWLPDACPDRYKYHTPCPSGYTAWFEWAERMGKTHRQIRCPTCGLLSVWVPKTQKKPATTPVRTRQPA